MYTHTHNTNENSVAGRTIEHYKEEENQHCRPEEKKKWKKTKFLVFFLEFAKKSTVKIGMQEDL
jgi:hypothetical protein